MVPIFIDNSDASYLRARSAIAQSLHNRRLIPFLGAGISIPWPSNLPDAMRLVRPIRRAMRLAASEVRGQYDQRRQRRREVVWAWRVLREARLERLLDVLYQTHGQPALEYLSILDGRSWNANHSTIQRMIQAGMLPHCITLNFDVLIEAAVEHCGGTYTTLCPLSGKRFTNTDGSAACQIIKPHGSFAGPTVPANRHALVSATLSQIGNHADHRNVEAMRPLFASSPSLLVAGYSDNDWDAFPILQQFSHTLSNVYWVQWARPKAVEQRDASGLRQMPKVIDWLTSLGDRACLLVGDVSELFRGVLEELGLPPAQLPEGVTALSRSVPDAGLFMADRAATALALARLLPEGGMRLLNRRLLRWILRQPPVEANPHVAALALRTLGADMHTRRKLKSAIVLNRAAIRIRKNDDSGVDATADDVLWLGYEYLCLAKSPKLDFSVLRLPFNVVKGHYLLQRAAETQGSRRKWRAAMAEYYRIDLLHCWAAFGMLLGSRVAKLFRWWFKLIDNRYSSLARRAPSLMEWEYYWLRHLEARLLSGRKVPFGETERRIIAMRDAHVLTQNDIQIGNTYAHLALVVFTQLRDCQRAQALLTQAEEHWSSSGGLTRSGLFRVAIFRRFMGLTGLRETLRLLAANG